MKKIYLIIFCSIIPFFNQAQLGQEKIITETFSQPQDSKPFDLNGDGNIDVLVASYGTSELAWYENLGGGVFSAMKIISNINSITIADAGDFDNDGDLDIIAISGSDNIIFYHENIGNGEWGAIQEITNSTSTISSVQISDIDNDGDLDILSALFNDDKIVYFKNLGLGIFSNQIIVNSIIDGPSSVYSADIDNDGELDILVASKNSGQIVWIKNLGNGQFDLLQIISSNTPGARSVYSSDVDGDGNMDVISTSLTGTGWAHDRITLHENSGNGLFNTHQILEYTENSPDGALFSRTADLDSDGDQDIICTYVYAGKIVYFENLGNSNFEELQIISTAIEANTIYPADFDNNGTIDILGTSNSNISWFKNDGFANFGYTPNNENKLKFVYYFTNTCDLNQDGKTDIISINYSSQSQDLSIGWFKNIGGLDFDEQSIIIIDSSRVKDVRCGDVDNDGDIDLIGIGSLSGEIFWFENLGNQIFSSRQIISNDFASTSLLMLYDINNNGLIDIVAFGGNKLVWYNNLGSGLFSTEEIISNTISSSNPRIEVSDIDNDNDLDILSFGSNDTSLFWFEQVSPNTFSSEQLISSDFYAVNLIHASDLDNDGDFDIVYTTNVWGVDDTLNWLPNLGNGVFGAKQQILNNIDNPSSILTVDLDNDGDQDILTSLFSDGFSLIENFGSGSFANQQVLSQFELIQNILSSDLDNDGDSDVIAMSGGKISVYENFSQNIKIKGKVFIDSNQNSSFESNEPGIDDIQIVLSPSNVNYFSQSNGGFEFSLDTGTFEISYLEDTLWNLTTNFNTYFIEVNSSSTIIDTLNFGFYPDTILSIIEPELTGGFPRCNSIVNYWIDLSNNGTTIPSGIYSIKLDDSISFFNSSIVPDSIVGQNVYWHFDSLFYFSQHQINLQVVMPDFMSIGDTLVSVLEVSEINALNEIIYFNQDSLSQLLLCAYDPNDKTSIPTGIGSKGYLSNDLSLEYLIRFQNTGNDTAITVMVRDHLDSDLDWSTFELISSSHSMETYIESDGEVVFNFENIMLPDSNINFLESQGYVKYRISMLPNLSGNTKIENEAKIYFDSNPPIITNKTLNTIYDCNSLVVNYISSVWCLEKEIELITPYDEISSYTWQVDGFINVDSNYFNWLIDTTNTFNITLNISNPICIKDTVITLEILPEIPITFVENTICDNDSIYLENEYRNISGLYTDTIQSFVGCDSILKTNLFVNSSYMAMDIMNICVGDSLLFFGAYHALSGLYYDSLQTVYGCDSVMIVELTPFNNDVGIDSQTACNSFTWINGVTYTSSNTSDSDTIYGGSLHGCDSIVTLDLTINTVDITTITDDPTITSYASNASFKWLDCNNDFLPISTEISSSFTPIQNGDFAVEVTQNNCVDTSDCITISTVGIEVNKTFEHVTIVPNPSSGLIKVDFGSLSNASIVIYSSVGSIVFEEKNINVIEYQLELNEPQGIYFIEISHRDAKKQFKLILE